MIQKNINGLEFIYKDIKSENLNPVLELYKGKNYINILNKFIYDCITNLNTKIFSFKKNYKRTITNLLSTWMFYLYSNRLDNDDSFFPSNYKNTDVIKKTILDYCKLDETIDKKNVDKILSMLVNSYRVSLNYIEKYKNSDYYSNNIKNYKIIKKRKIINDNIFYSFLCETKIFIKNKKLNSIINNLIIPENVYLKCKSKFTGNINKLDEYLWIIIFRYNLLGSNNHQLGVLPEKLKQMNKDFNLQFECFSSTLNSTFNNYCSIYYDVEKYFGSCGNFFNLKLIKGTYSFNPPYQSKIITEGINHLFRNLKEAKDNNRELNIIITIPIWDLNGKEKMNNIEDNIDYGEFEIINKVKESEFFNGLLMIPKEDFTYLDHNFNLYKDITIQNTYVILLSSKNNNYYEILKKYNFKKIDDNEIVL